MFECFNGGLTSDGRKVIEKFIDRFASFEIVQQILERNASAAENGRSTQYVWILCD